MKQKQKETNSLLYLAIQESEHVTPEEEIRNRNITELYEAEKEEIIKAGELINININGAVRKGKSTLGIAEAKNIHKIMKKYGLTKGTFGINNIFRDQQEFSKQMRDSEFNHTIAMIDERNELEEGGENVTVEIALLNQFSDVQAGRYVHKILCSPKSNIDSNSDIYLEVIQADKSKGTTHCHLYYNLFKGGTEQRMLLGYVEISVADVIKNWKKVMPIFYKEKKTEEEKKYIEEMRKKDYYVEYMIRKYEKMDLITREGIFRPRMLDYSEVIIDVEKELRPVSKLGILNKDMISNYVKKYTSEKKIPLTLLGKNEMTNEINGILSLWSTLNKIEIEIKKITAKGDVNNKLQALEETRISIINTIEAQLQELERLKKIKEKYDKKLS